MLEFGVDEPRLLQSVVDSVNQVCQEAILDCSASGLALSGMDSSHVSLVKLDLASEFFPRYRCDSSCNMGLHFGTLLKVMKMAAYDNQVTFIHKEHSDDLSIKQSRINDDSLSSTYQLKLINIQCERLEIPSNHDYVELQLSSRLLQKVFRDMTTFSEDIKIECPYEANQKERYIVISASGDIGRGEQILRDGCYSTAVDVKKDADYHDEEDYDEDTKPKNKRSKQSATENSDEEVVRTQIKYNEEFNAKKISTGLKMTFAAQYLNTFMKAASLTDKLTIFLAPDFPIELQFQINDFGSLSFYLAPRYTDQSVKDE